MAWFGFLLGFFSLSLFIGYAALLGYVVWGFTGRVSKRLIFIVAVLLYVLYQFCIVTAPFTITLK